MPIIAPTLDGEMVDVVQKYLVLISLYPLLGNDWSYHNYLIRESCGPLL